MKKLSFMTGILIFAALVLAVLGCVCSAVDQMATDAHFYSGMSRAAVARELGVTDDAQVSTKVTEYIGLTDAQQDEFAAQMAAFMAGETDEQPEILNDKEKLHMMDVRGLTQSAAEAGQITLTLAAVLAVIAAWTGARIKRRYLPQVIGMLGGTGAAAAVAAYVGSIVSGGGFAVSFVSMHEMMFSNDLWLMDPAQDILIRMMPQLLFEQALVSVAGTALRMCIIVLIMLIAVHVIVENMLRRHAAKAEE